MKKNSRSHEPVKNDAQRYATYAPRSMQQDPGLYQYHQSPPAAKGLLALSFSPKNHSRNGAGMPNPIAMNPNKLFPQP